MLSRLRRNAELGLLVLVGVITGGAYTLASLGRSASIPANIGPFLGLVLVLLLLAHLAVRRLAPRADGLLLPLAGLLNGIGYVMLTRLDKTLAGAQATWTLVGIVGFIVTLLVVRRTRDLARYRYTFALIGLILLLLPLAPAVGTQINGARIWVRLGGLSFQPGEFAKIVLAVFFAGYLVEKRELLAMTTWPKVRPVLPDPKHLGPVLVAWAAAVVIMTAEKDLGSSLLFFTLFMVMLWVATERGTYIVVGAVLFGLAAYGSWVEFAHVQSRVTNWINPWKDQAKGGYQVIQGWYSMAAGGVAGTGPGRWARPTRSPSSRTTSCSPPSARSWACSAPPPSW